MKLSGRKIAGIIILLACIIGFWLFRNWNDQHQQVKKPVPKKLSLAYTVKNKLILRTITLEGEFFASRNAFVSFPMSGILEEGIRNFKPRDVFSMGEILYQINNESAFLELSSKKMEFAQSIKMLLPELEIQKPSEKAKWENYALSIRRDDLLPPLPSFKNEAERSFFVSQAIVSKYLSVLELEDELRSYYYAAPFAGKFTEIYLKPGKFVAKRRAIAKIIDPSALELKVRMATNQLFIKPGESLDFNPVFDPNKKIWLKLSHVKIISADSSDYYFKPKSGDEGKIQLGTKLKTSYIQYASEPYCILPKAAVKNKNVKVVINKSVKVTRVEIVQIAGDSLLVSGLSDGEQILLKWDY